MIDWLYYLLLIVTLFAGLWFNIVGLPGLWLMVLGHAIYGWVTGWNVHVGWTSLIWVTVLALIAEGVEFLSGAAASKAAGGSKRGMVGAIIGGIVGAIVGSPILPIIGTIIGAVIGAGVGTFIVEMGIGRTREESLQISIGAAKGRFWGIVSKTLIGLIMLVVSAITALPFGAAAAPAPAGTPPPAAPPATQPATQPAMSLEVERPDPPANVPAEP